MTPRSSIIGRLSHSRLFGNDLLRRSLLVLLLVTLAVLTFFPEKQRAVITLSPTDPEELGLSNTLLQLGAGTSIFGTQTAVDLSMKVAESIYVRRAVDKQMQLQKRLGMDETHVMRWLNREVDIRALRGGAVQIQMKNRDGGFAQQMVDVYAKATRERLGEISRQQTDYKRQVLEDLVSRSGDRLSRAQAAYDSFRRSSEYGDPQVAISQNASRIPELEQDVLAKERALIALQQFATPQNPQIRLLRADLDAVRLQLAQARSAADRNGSLGQVIEQSTRALRLRRELDISRELYDSYRRFLQGTVVEDLTSNANMRILEPAYIDPERQVNYVPLALFIAVLLIGLATEAYRLRPSVGDASLRS